MSRFAADTQVSAERSRAEIERILHAYGANGFYYGSEPAPTVTASGRVVIGFRAHDRVVRFTLPLPPACDYLADRRGRTRSAAAAVAAHDQAVRQRWRCLVLAIKAKLEVVESGIASFEEEFLSQIVTPDGATVGHHVLPRIAEAYATGQQPTLLLEGPR